MNIFKKKLTSHSSSHNCLNLMTNDFCFSNEVYFFYDLKQKKLLSNLKAL